MRRTPHPVLASDDVRGSAHPLPQGERVIEQVAPAEGRLAENILYFARALRAAGIPVGPGAVLDALEAVQGGRRRHPRGFLLDAARGVREAPRAFAPVRSGVPHLLPPPRLYRSAHGDDAAAGAEYAAPARSRRDARARGAVLRPRRQAQKGARDRARHPPDRLRPRGAAAKGFRADDECRDRRRQGSDEAASAAACRSAHAAA